MEGAESFSRLLLPVITCTVFTFTVIVVVNYKFLCFYFSHTAETNMKFDPGS